MKIRYIFSSAHEADENSETHFRRLSGPTKLAGCFRQLHQPTKIALFSSATDEKEPIFIEFISSAYFRRKANENSYFHRHWAYFRQLLADENVLFSCSGGAFRCGALNYALGTTRYLGDLALEGPVGVFCFFSA
jgi:hypothetical protein